MNNQRDTHFAIYKPTNKIVYSWDYNGYDPAELRQFRRDYFIVDLIDNDIDYKQCKILTDKSLRRMGINTDDTSNWSNTTNESRIEKKVNEIVENVINEISKNKKSRITRDAINGIQNKAKNIRSIAILTAENPKADDIDYDAMDKREVRRNNKTYRKSLNQYLKDGHFLWKPVFGKYGSPENSVMIFNIDRDTAVNIGKMCNQSSIIFCVVDKEGSMSYCYYDDSNDFSAPTKVEKNIEVVNDDVDFFTAISKNFKFRIPFNFDEWVERLDAHLNEKFDSDKKRKLLHESVNAAPHRRYMCRGYLYSGFDF